jgi:hypothetical protein
MWAYCRRLNSMIGNKIIPSFEEVLQTTRWQIIDRYAIGIEKD